MNGTAARDAATSPKWIVRAAHWRRRAGRVKADVASSSSYGCGSLTTKRTVAELEEDSEPVAADSGSFVGCPAEVFPPLAPAEFVAPADCEPFTPFAVLLAEFSPPPELVGGAIPCCDCLATLPSGVP